MDAANDNQVAGDLLLGAGAISKFSESQPGRHIEWFTMVSFRRSNLAGQLRRAGRR